jgi:mono/diheme cytochrome c family protein
MPHLSELHGAATHLAVVAIPVYLIVVVLQRFGVRSWLPNVEPWVGAAAVVGIAVAGVSGLLVRGEAQTTLRGSDLQVGTIHFWLGIALAVLVVGVAAWRWRQAHRLVSLTLVAAALAATVMVFAQGYLGGRMTYQQAVGIYDGGQLAQSAAGASRLNAALKMGTNPVQAGKQAFSEMGLGCASCHGDQAQGERGPRLAGGVELEEFRGVHGHGLFPPRIVSDRDFAAIDAYLKTLGRSGPDAD